MPSGMGYGAQAGLQDVLTRLFLEAQEKHRQKMSESQLALQERSAAATEGLRQAQLDANIANQTRLDEDRDENRKIQEEARFHGRLKLLPKGTRLSGPEAVEFVQRGVSGLLKPVQNEPAFEFAGTQDTENKENALALRAEQQGVLQALQQGRLDIAQAMLELAKTRTSWGPQPITIQTSDPSGNAVTKVVPRGQATGQEFPAAPTSEQRNRQAASGRAAPVLQAISELSERINVGKGVAAKLTGEVERKKAEINLNDDISEYEAVVSGFTPLLARAVGHVGVLTEQDVQSVRRMLPAPGDSKSVRDRKVARIQSLMGTISGPQQNEASPASPPQETKEQRMQRLLKQSGG